MKTPEQQIEELVEKVAGDIDELVQLVRRYPPFPDYVINRKPKELANQILFGNNLAIIDWDMPLLKIQIEWGIIPNVADGIPKWKQEAINEILTEQVKRLGERYSGKIKTGIDFLPVIPLEEVA